MMIAALQSATTTILDLESGGAALVLTIPSPRLGAAR
jgi:hypothetical protein